MGFGRTTAVALALGVLVGCGGGESLDPESPVIAAQEAPGDTPAAAMEGTLAEADGCLVMGDSVVVWGKDTTWDAETDEVVTSDGDRFSLGELVSGGGGQIPDPRDYFGDAVADRLELCGGRDTVYLTT